MSFNSFDVSASALYAQRVKMDAISSNIANVNTTRNPDGTPGAYKRKEVLFSSAYDNALNQDSGIETDMQNVNINSYSKTENASISTGVKVGGIVEDASPFRRVYDPGHPDADKDGYVNMPNVNIVKEMTDMITASRAYDANCTAIDTTKSMLSSAMKI